MAKLADDFTKGLEAQHELLARKDEARERVKSLTAKMTRDTRKAIQAIHSSAFFPEANDSIKQAMEKNHEVAEILKVYPSLFPIAQTAQKELAEANILFYIRIGAAVSDIDVFNPESLEIDAISYLHGLAEVVGELGRSMRKHIREGEITLAEHDFELMESIYEILYPFTTYPDGMTNNFKQKADITHNIILSAENIITIAIDNARTRADNK